MGNKEMNLQQNQTFISSLPQTLANCDYFSELGRGSKFITRLSFIDKKDASLHRIKVIVWFVFIPLQPRLPPPTCDPRGEIESN